MRVKIFSIACLSSIVRCHLVEIPDKIFFKNAVNKLY